jgi:hypothetical protein
MSIGKKQIYHITHKDNLEGIISQRRLFAQSLIAKNPVSYYNIAHTTIQDRRALTPVPCGPGGHLHEYVPFYFAPRSPMLYAIHQRNVEHCDASQADIVYLISNTETIASSGIKFVFTDGHAIMDLSDYYDDLTNLNMIDWKIMKETYWADTNEDPDRKRRRQAEFLIYEEMPVDLIDMIVVLNETTKIFIEKMIKKFEYQMPVKIKPEWYY